jgi:Fe-S-cluster-containing dehydrogenase component/DMSO reductase anchor subunit
MRSEVLSPPAASAARVAGHRAENALTAWSEPASTDESRTLIDDLLEEQQRLTAVERFARLHESGASIANTSVYRALIPAGLPEEGEQFAFSVDLDACSGCKACVTACHSLNGLDAEETWRDVGLLYGGDDANPFQQTVTTACHHCVDPACLNGCPVLAYDKDPRTGIVRHLDDQCIGCQYCVLKCPYDVPKYSARRGIVRKCDMCANRLAVAEAPACAQACPNGAITITIVNQAAVAADAGRGSFLPASPDPSYTLPTTRYTSARGMPKNLVAADRHQVRPESAHPPLVVMLVLTQLSVGAFCMDTLLRARFPANLMNQISPGHALIALLLGLLALGASTLHLGRPKYAWRAVLGLRRSWLSREIVAFGLFAALAMLAAGAWWWAPLRALDRGVNTLSPLALAVCLSGLLGVFCSLKLYEDTRRPFWNGPATGYKFFGTAALLGAAAILFLTTLQALLFSAVTAQGAYHQLTDFLTISLAVISSCKLAAEAAVFRHLRQTRTPATAIKRTAMLLIGELAEITTARFLLGGIGGVLLPLAFLVQQPAPGFATLGVTVWILLFTISGELIERYLFFVAVVASKMPGGLAA